MKKSLYIFIFVVLFSLFSCTIYTPVKDYSHEFKKIEYKSFAELNEPFVFKFDKILEFNKKDSDRTTTQQRGSYYVIYDWETESVFDYVYVPGDNSSGYVGRTLDMRKTKNGDYVYLSYYSDYRDEKVKLYFLNSSKNKVDKIEIEETEDYKRYYAFSLLFSTYKDDNLFVFMDKDSESEYRLIFVEADTQKEIKKKLITSKNYLEDFCVDSTGSVWFNTIDYENEFVCFGYYNYKTDELNQNYLELDIQDDCYYNLLYSDEKVLIIEKEDLSDGINNYIYSYIVVRKQDNPNFLYKEFCLENYNVKSVWKYNDEYFLVTNNENYEEISTDRIYKLNQNLEEIEEIKEVATYLNYYNELKDDKIIFFDEYTDYEKEKKGIEFFYYDIAKKTFKDGKKFLIKEILDLVEN